MSPTASETIRIAPFAPEPDRLRAEVEIHRRLGAHLLAAHDLTDAFQRVLDDLCRIMEWSFGEVWLPDPGGEETLACAATHVRDSALREEYQAAMSRLRLRPGDGPAGEAWRTREAAWLPEVDRYPRLVSRKIFQDLCIKTGVGIPVLDGASVVAVLVFFLHEVSKEDAEFVRLLAAVAAHLGLYVRWKQTADQLRSREVQLAEAQRLSELGSWSWDLRTNEMAWSDQLFRNLGLSPGCVKPSIERFLERIHEEDRALVREHLRRLHEGASPPEFLRLRVPGPGDEECILEVRATVERDEAGTILRLMGTNQNVTVRVRAEAALREQGAMLEEMVQKRTGELRAANALLEAEIVERRKAEALQQRWTDLLREVLLCADELIACVSRDSFYRRAVELPRERLGLDRTGLLMVEGDQMLGTYGTDARGRTLDEHDIRFGVPLHGPEDWAARLVAIREGGRRWFVKEVDVYPQYLNAERDPEQSGGWVVITAIVHEGALLGFFSNDSALSRTPVDSVQQEVLAVYCTVLGSLLRTRAMAKKLADEEQRLRRVVENLPAGALLIEANRVFYNPQVETITGYGPGEMESLDQWFDALYGPRAAEIRALYEEDRRQGFPEPRIVLLRRKDGQDRYVRFAAFQHEEAVVVLLQDITDGYKNERRIREYQGQLRSLATEIGLAEERERRRIASGLHDQVVQMLAMAKIRLGAFEGDFVADAGQKRAVGDIRKLLEGAIQETRSLTFELSPPVLYELGLEAALDWLAERTERKHGLRCSVSRQAARIPVPVDHAVVLFQAARELVNNAVNHARASRLMLGLLREGETIRLDVEDDGVGFNVPRLAEGRHEDDRHFGLFNVREQIRQMGGQTEVVSAPGSGCRISLRVPALCPDEEREGATP